MQSEYLNNIYNELQNKTKNEPEFLQAVLEFFESIDDFVINNKEIEENAIIERLVEPERYIEFRVPWEDDNGKIHVNRGYRVEFNSAIGPYKGGLRFHPSVNRSIIKFLGFEQIFKNSITGLSMGGGKGGSDFDPKGKSDREIMRFCQSFMAELFRHIGPNTDVPAGDIGVGAREIGYLFGYYKKLRNEFTGVLTGKDLTFGGSLIRPEATGYGLCYFTNRMLQVMKQESFEGKKVIISGSGNVALYALQKAKELGAAVIAMSDSSGYIYNPNGISFELMNLIKNIRKERIKEYLNYDQNTKYEDNPKNIWSLKADIILPCATQNEIDLEDAKKIVANGAICVSEGANMPSTLEATKYFIEHKLCFGPAKAANSGGVMTSGFEMSQNSMRLSWTREEVNQKLKDNMEQIFDKLYQITSSYEDKYDTVKGANILGFSKVAKAMIKEGLI